MHVVVVIPARQWSAGVPAKNRLGFNETLEIAEALTGTVIVTTDDPLLWDIPGVTTVRRPPELEDGPSGPVIAHALRGVDADVVLVLQPCSPSHNRITYCQAALDVLRGDHAVSSVTSVVPWVGEPPQKAVYRVDGQLVILDGANERRQACAPAYRRDGTVYAVRGVYAAEGDLYGPRPVPLLVTPADSVTVDDDAVVDRNGRRSHGESGADLAGGSWRLRDVSVGGAASETTTAVLATNGTRSAVGDAGVPDDGGPRLVLVAGDAPH